MTPEALSLAHTLVETLEEKKGEDVLLLDLTSVCTFTDYFVICTGSSERTLQALADEVLRRTKRGRGHAATQVEGSPRSGWMLLDYGGVILHLFSPESRDYYRLEDLWKGGKVVLRLK